jgi:hypothetical protein
MMIIDGAESGVQSASASAWPLGEGVGSKGSLLAHFEKLHACNSCSM